MASKKHSLPDSFLLAFSGIFKVIKDERNIKIHLIITAIVILMGLFLAISKMEWLVIFLIVGATLAAEVFNSSIEEICDLLREENHLEYQRTKFIRDVSAGAVLILVITSVAIGLVIFLPYLL